MPRFGSLRGKRVRQTLADKLKAKNGLNRSIGTLRRDSTGERASTRRYNEAYDHGTSISQLRDSGMLGSVKDARRRELLSTVRADMSKIEFDRTEHNAKKAQQFRQSKVGKIIRLVSGGPKLWKRTASLKRLKRNKLKQK